jgi:hypothetical protein
MTPKQHRIRVTALRKNRRLQAGIAGTKQRAALPKLTIKNLITD